MSALPLTSLPKPSATSKPAAAPKPAAPRSRDTFAEFVADYRDRLAHLFGERHDLNLTGPDRGLSPFVLQQFRDVDPMSVYIPECYGGRGGSIAHSMTMLEETSYHSLPLSLILGINGGLFLQPVVKYGSEEAKASVLPSIMRKKRLAGLMITEPRLRLRRALDGDGAGARPTAAPSASAAASTGPGSPAGPTTGC